MKTLTIMVGLPALGKSTRAEEITKNNRNCVLVSSDALREKTLCDVQRQDQNGFIFSMMYQMTLLALNSDKDVVYDATNISEVKRRTLVKNLRRDLKSEFFVKVIYFLGTNYDSSSNNRNRERHVPASSINRIYTRLDVPTKRDLDYIDEIEYYSILEGATKSTLGSILEVKTYEEFSNIMFNEVDSYQRNRDLPQDQPNQTLSVSRHIYEAFKYAKDYIPEDLIEHLTEIRYALAFHGLGKAFCKTFKPGSRYAEFTDYQKVSTQIFLKEASQHSCLHKDEKIDKDFIVGLIKEHNLPCEETNRKAYEAALDEVEIIYGEVFRNCLEFMRECEISAR